MVTGLLLAAVLNSQGKEISFLELEELKWKATKDIKSGSAEWQMTVPGADGEGQQVRVLYRAAGERILIEWRVDDQRFEIGMWEDGAIIVNHTEKRYFSIDQETIKAIKGESSKSKEEEKFEPVKVEEGTFRLVVSQFQTFIQMNPHPKWVSTTSVEVDGKTMTLVTHRATRDDGSLRGELKQWFPQGKWIAERATFEAFSEEGAKVWGEATVKSMDLSGRLKPEDVKVPKSSYTGYSSDLDEETGYHLLNLLLSMRGQ